MSGELITPQIGSAIQSAYWFDVDKMADYLAVINRRQEIRGQPEILATDAMAATYAKEIREKTPEELKPHAKNIRNLLFDQASGALNRDFAGFLTKFINLIIKQEDKR